MPQPISVSPISAWLVQPGAATEGQARALACRGAGWLTAAMLAFLLAACGGGRPDSAAPSSTATPIPNTPPVAATPSPAPSPSLGVVEVELSGLGSTKASSTLRWLSTPPSPASPDTSGPAPLSNPASPAPKSIANLPAGLDFSLQSAGFADIGSRSTGGTRYISATYLIRNAAYCSTPGTCTPYAQARHNLTFLAVVTSATVNASAVSRFIRFDASPADPALATQLVPTHGMDSTATAVEDARASLQLYRESELPAVDPSALSVLPYGFVVRNASDGSRTLRANPANHQFDGRVTFAFKIPLQPSANADPFKIALRFQIVEDSSTRVTQSAEEASPAGDIAARARATALGSTDLVVPCSRKARQLHGNPICSTRLAGMPDSPTASFGSTPASPTVVASPANLGAVARDAAIVLGTSHAMAAPSHATLRVHGSHSGLRTLSSAYAAAIEGGTGSQTHQLIARLRTGDKPFFRGETVSFSATASNSSSSGAALAPFVGQFVVQGSASGSTGGFSPAAALSAGGYALKLALGDLNGDGHLDMVNTAYFRAGIRVWLGDGTGGFSDYTSHGTGTGPTGVALGDLNGDGALDIAVTNYESNTVSVLLGNGTGGFSAATAALAVGQSPYDLVLGDIDSDGDLDILTVNYEDNSVSVLRNQGSGNFDAAVRIAVGVHPYALTLGDLNSDGKLDIVVANGADGDVGVLLGNGDGSFAAQIRTNLSGTGSSQWPMGVALADLDSDGHLDLVTANFSGHRVSVLRGDGTGHFLSIENYGVGSYPYAIALADVNGDGLLDIIVPNSHVDSISVLLGHGDSRFSAHQTTAVGDWPSGLAIGDINGDGRLDLLTSNFTELGSVSVLLGQ